VTQDEEFKLIEETLLQNDNVCLLAKDKEGHHMLEKIITSFTEEKRKYIFNNIIENFKELATDKQGLCVLKKLIEFTKDPISQKAIISKILENALEYVQNAFGNFVVSEVLNQFKYETCSEIFTSIKGHYVQLSQNKFSSKFIEVCIDKAPKKVQHEIIREFCDSKMLSKVVNSNFGNFVLQNSLKTYCKSEEQRNLLIERIIQSLKEVQDYKVQVKWGEDILHSFVEKVNNQDSYDHLS
jgi:hypothetical protein